VRADGGAALFGHTRVGQGGQVFQCLKFRSMVVDAKERLVHLLATSPQARAEWEKDFKLKNDPRINAIGHFLRRTSLDELPQLWNVLRGDMSLVGPRPVVQDELLRYGYDVSYYLQVRPGITGLWQVSGRNDVDYETRVYLDAWYVKNWALWNDIAILFKTVRVVFDRSGAY
jgi:Undecaprenyl-phosphate galactose phosphotransferase WbaP